MPLQSNQKELGCCFYSGVSYMLYSQRVTLLNRHPPCMGSVGIKHMHSDYEGNGDEADESRATRRKRGEESSSDGPHFHGVVVTRLEGQPFSRCVH